MREETISMDVNNFINYGEKNGSFITPKIIDEKNEKMSQTILPFGKVNEEKIWQEVIGKEICWRDMRTPDKIKTVAWNIIKIMGVFVFLYFFICSLDLLSSSFRLISGKSTGAMMNNRYMKNPIVGLMIGILVTVLVQSSSTSTSIIVSMVASKIIHVKEAIPMIMGSNIGTSVTNTIVSMTQVGNREQFRRAFAGATVHDMFNWLSVIVILSLEVLTGVLEKVTNAIVTSFAGGNGLKVEILDVITEPFTDLVIQLDSRVLKCWGMGFMMEEASMIKKYCNYVKLNVTNGALLSAVSASNNSLAIPSKCQSKAEIGEPHSCSFIFYETSMTDVTIGIILLVVSLTILCTSLVLIVKVLNSMLKGSIATVIQKVINADIPYVPWLTGYIAILIGAVLTFIVQSSSVFTSTLTPLIGIGIISVERAYPLTLGSNLGTTTTALLAAMASVGDKTNSIQIALVHTFFNILGILIFYPLPFMRWPIPLCKILGNTTANYRWFAIFYLVSMFFLIPGAIFALSLGGSIVLWSVLGPAIAIFVFAIIINLLQRKLPHVLPRWLENWDFLPYPLHSLAPYDRVFTSLPCCTKCRVVPIVGEGESSQSDLNIYLAPEQPQQGQEMPEVGIDNPIKVTD